MQTAVIMGHQLFGTKTNKQKISATCPVSAFSAMEIQAQLSSIRKGRAWKQFLKDFPPKLQKGNIFTKLNKSDAPFYTFKNNVG